MTTDAPFGFLRLVPPLVRAFEARDQDEDDTSAGEHGPNADLRRAHDEHPCRCAHHRETTKEQR